MLLELSTIVDENETNYFELMRQIAKTKVKVGRSYPYLTIFLEEAAHEPEQALAVKTAASRQSYEERLDAYLKHAEIDNVSDKGRRERIKKMLEYTISGIIREKTAQAAETDAIFREIKAYIDLVRDMALSLP